MKTEKDWTRALREQCYPEEAAPSAGSWSAITGKMHRRAVRRWSVAAVLALLLPAGGVLLWRPAPAAPAFALEQRALDPEPMLLSHALLSARVMPLPPRKAMYAGGTAPAGVTAAEAPEDEPVAVPADGPGDAAVENPEAPEAAAHAAGKPSGGVTEPSESCTEPSAFEPFSDVPERPVRRKSRLSFTLQAGSAAGQRDSYPLMEYARNMSLQSKAAANIYWNNLMNSSEALQLHYRHDMPLSLGINLRWQVSGRIALESGVTYSYLHSYEEHAGDQKLHFVGIPLKLDVHLFSAGLLDVGVGAYGMGEKCLSAEQGGIRYQEPALQWSAGAFLDAGCRLGRLTTLYLQPSLSYYFTKTNLLTYRTENPLGFTLQAGLRFHL